MGKSVIQGCWSLVALASLFYANASAADIYQSQKPDGSFHYSSQRIDTSYALYLKDDSKTANTSPAPRSILSLPQRRAIDAIIEECATKHQVDIALVRAVVEVESAFNVAAKSPKGAVGLMQLMPATATRYGLKDLLARHNGNIALTLAAYNAGEGSVAKYGKRIPPYQETMLYVAAVLTKLHTARNHSSP
jgi:soluble lytic murein transglycosylase-like protein